VNIAKLRNFMELGSSSNVICKTGDSHCGEDSSRGLLSSDPIATLHGVVVSPRLCQKYFIRRMDDRGSRVRFPAGAGNFSLHHRV
jgi:hypothetical protein